MARMFRYPLFSFAGVIFSCAVSPHGYGVHEDHFSSTTLLAAIVICVRGGCFVFELCCSCSCFVSHWVSSQETRILPHEFYSCGRVVSAVCSVSLRCVPLDFPSLETRVLFLGLVRMLLVRVCSVLSVPWPVFIYTAQGREMT